MENSNSKIITKYQKSVEDHLNQLRVPSEAILLIYQWLKTIKVDLI